MDSRLTRHSGFTSASNASAARGEVLQEKVDQFEEREDAIRERFQDAMS
ncbi:hypothetical protein Halar_0529 (plasmid) [halophilic archaeon DL31]|jgi:hypothetical protein|nr:hypothetical protein Halar_0529 [halophilic archaeon DL31]